jgi:hypothetical protein
MRRVVYAAVAVAAGLVGCVTGPLGSDAIVPAAAAAASAATRVGMAPADITRAADLYALKCAKCHKFYDPAGYSDKEWAVWMTKMSKKSRLEPDEQEVLARYLDASRAQAAVPRP